MLYMFVCESNAMSITQANVYNNLEKCVFVWAHTDESTIVRRINNSKHIAVSSHAKWMRVSWPFFVLSIHKFGFQLRFALRYFMDAMDDYDGEFYHQWRNIPRIYHRITHWIIISSHRAHCRLRRFCAIENLVQTTETNIHVSISGRALFLFISFELLLLKTIVAKFPFLRIMRNRFLIYLFGSNNLAKTRQIQTKRHSKTHIVFFYSRKHSRFMQYVIKRRMIHTRFVLGLEIRWERERRNKYFRLEVGKKLRRRVAANEKYGDCNPIAHATAS